MGRHGHKSRAWTAAGNPHGRCKEVAARTPELEPPLSITDPVEAAVTPAPEPVITEPVEDLPPLPTDDEDVDE